MEKLNIILKSFDGPDNHIAIEQALKNMNLGTCISLLWDLRETPTLNADEHLLFNSKTFKNGDYDGTDWTTITPLDEELIESMRHCEGIFMVMLTRHSLDPIPYEERRRQYFDHLRYWNHILETKKINFFLLNHPPHQSYDYVIYELCRLKKIPTLIMYRCDCLGVALLVETWEEFSTEVRDTFRTFQKEYCDPSVPIPLSEHMERYYEGQTLRDESPWNMYPRPSYLLQKNFFRKWARMAMRMFVYKPRKFLSLVASSQFWSRKIREHNTIAFYDSHVTEPDYSQPYIYVPLHMQPEATTCPIGGAFVDQERIVQLLAWHLPKGVQLYVKEHPHQRELMRSRAFYQSLLEIPSVRLVPRNTPSATLAKNAFAVATVTGTAGFEALFHEKPVLLFGHIYYQYASGVHMIRTAEDCRRAVERVVERKEKPTLRDIRMYLKAIDTCCLTYDFAPDNRYDTALFKERLVRWGESMGHHIRHSPL